MMKCLGAVMALLVLLPVSPANAANELGLFFGEYPGIRPPASLYEPVAPFTPIRAHLVLYGPTMPQLAGWACSVGLQGTAYLFDVTFYHGGVNAGDFPELSVQYPSPIATEDGLVLMTLWYLPRDLEANCLALSGPSGLPPGTDPPLLRIEGGQDVPATVYTYGDGNVVAQINGTDMSCWGVVDAAVTGWGALKALYR
ncbi:MAG: hypothetical protein IPI48_11510 [bacterium]|nr:hypothetical protein [bacterium]